ncbi:hypothetical protein JCM13580A_49780 [Streptomyces drozdowiczii]
MSVYVTTGTALRATVPPNTVRARRTDRCPSFTHSTHWWPTAASRMQEGHMKRSQRTQLTYVSYEGWR